MYAVPYSECRSPQLWRSFFEAAAAQQVTLDGESSGTFAPSGQTGYEDETITIPHDDSYLSSAQQEGSFIFQPATSSTPLPGRTHQQDRSWEDSMESPFERMDRKIEDLKWDDNYAESSSAATPSLPSGYSMPKYSTGDSSYDVSTGTVEPADLPRPSHFQGSNTPKAQQTSKKWDGITDLRHTPLNAKFGQHKAKQSQSKSSLHSNFDDLSLDDSDDDIKMMMSPPVTMKFALPPRVSAIMDLAKTPQKGTSTQSADKQGEARMIVDDLLEAMSSDSPAMPEPKEFGRYSIAPPGYDTSRRLFDAEGSVGPNAATARQSMANTSYGSDIVEDENNVAPTYGDEDSFDEDSFDSAFGQTIRQDLPPVDGEYGDVTQSDVGDLSIDQVFGNPQKMLPGNRGNFNLLKQDEMLTFRGGKLEDAAGAEEFRSPTGHLNRR